MKELNLEEKKDKLSNLSLNDNTLNSIFFTTRNLKINELLDFIENYFQKLNFVVSAKWRESSFGNPSLVIEYEDKNKIFEYSCYIKRNNMIKNDKFSQLIYQLENPKLMKGYYPYKLSQTHLTFSATLNDTDFLKELTNKINLCNYPFDRILKEEDKAKLSENVSIDSIVEMFNISKQSSLIYLSYKVRNYFKQNGFFVNTEFKDNSIYLNLNKFNTSLKINLEEYNLNSKLVLDNRFHTFKDIEIFNNNLKSKKLNDFILFVNSKKFEDFIKNAILGTNYPFDKPSHSGF